MPESKISYFLLLFIFGCVESFEIPSAASNQGILVVEGRISNEETTISLSRTSNLDSFRVFKEEGAFVFLEDGSGSAIQQLGENEPGEYSAELDLTVGNSYRVRIQTRDNETYLSELNPLVTTPPISTLDVEIDTANLSLEILLSTQSFEGGTRYYLWDYEETYQYTSAYVSRLVFDGSILLQRPSDANITTCWKTEFSTDILLQSSIQLDEDLIADKLIVRYPLDGNQKFGIAYSILVNQYALSAEEFEFWTLLEKNTETLGTLFDPQPSQISTNVECITDPQKRVIGYVGASSKAQSRIFIIRNELPRVLRRFEYDCTLDTLGLDPDLIVRTFSNENLLPIDYIRSEMTGDTLGLLYSQKFCVDCREQNGTTVKPDFWF